MSTKQKNVLLWVAIVILIFLTTPWFGALYEKIIGRELSPGFWGPSNPEYIPGFMMAFIVVPILLLTIFRKSYKQILIVLGIVLLFDISIGAWWSGVVFDLGLAIAAWLLAQGILLVKKAIK